MKVNRDVGDVEDGFVCFACREREEMKGEIGRLRQVVCELVERVSGGVGRVPVHRHSQREVVNCCTQTEARVVTVCTTSQTELGVTGGKRGVCEPGESTQTKEVGCMAGGVVKDTAEWELVSGRRAYAKVVQQARVEVVLRCCREAIRFGRRRVSLGTRLFGMWMTWCVGRGPRSACGSVCLALASRTYAIGWQVWWDLGKGGQCWSTLGRTT